LTTSNFLPSPFDAALKGDEFPLLTHLLAAAHQMSESSEHSRPGILWPLFDGLGQYAAVEARLKIAS
jgi:hypothetical protein